MGYTTDDAMVRVDFFKLSGKWYTTEAVKWTGNYEGGLVAREFAKSLHDHLLERETQPGRMHESRKPSTIRLSGMIAVCLKPFHQHAHPLLLQVDEVEGLLAQR